MAIHSFCSVSLVLVVFVFLLGCQGGGAGAGTSLPFEGTEWSLVELEGRPLQERSEITLQVSEGDVVGGEVAGFAGINRYFGAVVRESDETVEFGAMGSTRMAGPPELMDQEATYLRLLQESSSLQISGNELKLLRNGEVVLVYRAIDRSAQ